MFWLGTHSLGVCIKPTFGFPLLIAALQDFHVLIPGDAQGKTCLGGETTGIAVDQYRLVFGDFRALLEHFTPFDIDRSRDMTLGKLASVTSIDDHHL